MRNSSDGPGSTFALVLVAAPACVVALLTWIRGRRRDFEITPTSLILGASRYDRSQIGEFRVVHKDTGVLASYKPPTVVAGGTGLAGATVAAGATLANAGNALVGAMSAFGASNRAAFSALDLRIEFEYGRTRIRMARGLDAGRAEALLSGILQVMATGEPPRVTSTGATGEREDGKPMPHDAGRLVRWTIIVIVILVSLWVLPRLLMLMLGFAGERF